MSKQVGWAIVGCGVIGPRHAAAVNAIPSAKLVATCDVIAARAQELAEKSHALHWYTDYNDMLQRDDIDVVSVCVPSGAHGEVAIAAARAQKHVFVEKPLEITRDKITSLIDTCHEQGVKLGCVFQNRTNQLYQYVRQVVQEGKLGKMLFADAVLKYHRAAEYYQSADWRGTWALDGGGCLMNQGVHAIDLLVWIAGEVDSVVAQATHMVRAIEVEDTVVAILQYRNGAYGVLEGATSLHVGRKPRLEFDGAQGQIVLEGSVVRHWNVPGVPAPQDMSEGPGAAHSDPQAISKTGHVILIEDMVRAVLNDDVPMISGEEARKAVDLILAIYESAATGKRVYLS